jgi:hypothetical protein
MSWTRLNWQFCRISFHWKNYTQIGKLTHYQFCDGSCSTLTTPSGATALEVFRYGVLCHGGTGLLSGAYSLTSGLHPDLIEMAEAH